MCFASCGAHPRKPAGEYEPTEAPVCCVQVEEFDYFIRKKDQAKAETGLAEAKTALDKVLSAVA